METPDGQNRQEAEFEGLRGVGPTAIGDLVPGVLDSGKRRRRPLREFFDDEEVPPGREYRARTPTNSERLNRALAELSASACKIHLLLWKWRGAPARGLLPFFTIHSLSRFCKLSRPTVRMALRELMHKGWIRPEPYNKHHKNTLFRLVSIRKVPPPVGARPDRRGRGVEKPAG
ncbi:hypothetical protein ES703_66187 [subsurface metagenome]